MAHAILPPHEVLSQLQNFQGEFPRLALESAVAQPEAVREGLLAFLIQAAESPLALPLEATGHLHAMILLAAWGEPRAFEPLLHLLALPSELVDHVLAETLESLLPRALASTCQGREGLLMAAAEVNEAYDYCRMAAVKALKILMLAGQLDRTDLLGFYRRLIRALPKRIEAFPWDLLVKEINEIHPAELESDIRGIFAAGLINPYFLREEHLEFDLAPDPQARLEALRHKAENRMMEEPLSVISQLEVFAKKAS